MHSALSPERLLETLDSAARRGKLAGFARGSAGELFVVTDFGKPYESTLVAKGTSQSAGTVVRFETRIKPLIPLIFAVGMIATVWPGVWLTDSMLRSYFTGYDYKTWMWYLPLSAPFVPWALWVAWKRSRKSAMTEAREIIATIAKLTDAKIEHQAAA